MINSINSYFFQKGFLVFYLNKIIKLDPYVLELAIKIEREIKILLVFFKVIFKKKQINLLRGGRV